MVFLTVLLLLWSGSVAAQEKSAIRGYVRDASTGETLPHASVRVDSLQIGSVADRSGYFLLQSLPPGKHHVQFSLCRPRVFLDTPLTYSRSERRVHHEQDYQGIGWGEASASE